MIAWERHAGKQTLDKWAAYWVKCSIRPIIVTYDYENKLLPT